MDELQVKADRTFNSLDVFMDKCQQISKTEVDRVVTLLKYDSQRIVSLEQKVKAIDMIQKNINGINASIS
jgi:hypothetical protein